MQTKKEEIRQDIIKSAAHEFRKKGYAGASLRTIAARANTTIGNLYNYFPGKRAILDAVLDGVPEQVETILDNHDDETIYRELLSEYNLKHQTKIKHIGPSNYHLFMDKLTERYFPLDVLLGDPFLILLDGCEGTPYQEIRDRCIARFTAHVATHLGAHAPKALPEIIAAGFLSSLSIIANSRKPMKEKMNHLKEYIAAVSFGMPNIT